MSAGISTVKETPLHKGAPRLQSGNKFDFLNSWAAGDKGPGSAAAGVILAEGGARRGVRAGGTKAGPGQGAPRSRSSEPGAGAAAVGGWGRVSGFPGPAVGSRAALAAALAAQGPGVRTPPDAWPCPKPGTPGASRWGRAHRTFKAEITSSRNASEPLPSSASCWSPGMTLSVKFTQIPPAP